jgi:hypothetical protein
MHQHYTLPNTDGMQVNKSPRSFAKLLFIVSRMHRRILGESTPAPEFRCPSTGWPLVHVAQCH